MAKYEITYKCGHTGTVELFGKGSDRERKLEWMSKNHICPECLEKEKQAAQKAIIEEAKNAGLPELTGSEKQVAWAISIRQTFIEAIENGIATSDAKYADNPQWTESRSAIVSSVEYIKSTKTEAKWWIDTVNGYPAISVASKVYAAEIAAKETTPAETTEVAIAEPVEAKSEPIMKEVEVLYRDYKNTYWAYKTKPDSYNACKKTIIIYVPEDLEIPKEEEPNVDTTEWKSFEINIQNVEKETGSSILVKCPNSSNYHGYTFWFPSKLVHNGSHSYALRLSITDDFTVKLKKYGKHYKLLAEAEVDAEELAEMFGGFCEPLTGRGVDAEYTIVTEPEKIDVDSVVVEVPECLLNNSEKQSTNLSA